MNSQIPKYQPKSKSHKSFWKRIRIISPFNLCFELDKNGSLINKFPKQKSRKGLFQQQALKMTMGQTELSDQSQNTTFPVSPNSNYEEASRNDSPIHEQNLNDENADLESFNTLDPHNIKEIDSDFEFESFMDSFNMSDTESDLMFFDSNDNSQQFFDDLIL